MRTFEKHKLANPIVSKWLTTETGIPCSGKDERFQEFEWCPQDDSNTRPTDYKSAGICAKSLILFNSIWLTYPKTALYRSMS